jgi:hypothetical protein
MQATLSLENKRRVLPPDAGSRDLTGRLSTWSAAP